MGNRDYVMLEFVMAIVSLFPEESYGTVHTYYVNYGTYGSPVHHTVYLVVHAYR